MPSGVRDQGSFDLVDPMQGLSSQGHLMIQVAAPALAATIISSFQPSGKKKWMKKKKCFQ